MSTEQTANANTRKQAIEWLLARHSDAWSAADQQALEAWLAADEEHRRQYRQMEALWRDMDAFKPLDFPQRQAARQYRPPTGLDNVVNFPGYTPAPNPPPTHTQARPEKAWLKSGLSLAASLALALGLYGYCHVGAGHYRTAIGEQRHISLGDGSEIVLNTGSELSVELGFFQRRVSLIRGEALFSVAHNPLRPFSVTAANGQIRDIGTRFNVHLTNKRVDVAVLEGEVDIATGEQTPVALGAGQAASYAADGRVQTATLNHPQAVTAWEQGKLIFAAQPLTEVLAQIARYHPVEFQIADPKLADLKISGSFKAANLPLLLQTLEAGFPLKARIVDEGVVRLQSASRN